MGALPPDSAWTPQDDFWVINALKANNPVVSAEPSSLVMEFELLEKSDDANNILGGAGNNDDSQLVDYMIVDPVIDNFGNTHFNFNVMPNSFTEHGAGDSIYASEGVTAAPSSAFPIGQNHNEDVSLGSFSFQDFTNGIEDTIPLAENRETIAPIGELFQPSEPKLPAMAGQLDDDGVRNASSVYESQVFTTAFPDSASSFHNLGYEATPVPTLPDFDHGGKELCTQNTLVAPVHDGADKMDTTGYGVVNIVNSSSSSEDKTSSDILSNSLPDTDVCMDKLSDFLFNGNDDQELLFTGPDGNETIDASSFNDFSSLLLDTPNESDMTDKGVSEILKAPDQQLPIPDGTCPRELSDNYTDKPLICNSEVQRLSSAVAVDPAFHEPRGGAISCMLNSHVQEVPNNDRFFLPVGMLSTSKQNSLVRSHISSGMIGPALQAGDSRATNAFYGAVKENITQAEERNNHCSQNNAGIPRCMEQKAADFSAVFKNHLNECGRKIMKMKAAADACKEMATASQAALAVLHGRHSKYLIRKTQVLLGRGTADVKVDIDLSREGRADKISRQQATIMMDDHGQFHLKNVGRCSIHVNVKKLLPGQRVTLTTGSLIKVSDATLRFEMNRSQIRHYIDNLYRSQMKPREK